MDRANLRPFYPRGRMTKLFRAVCLLTFCAAAAAQNPGPFEGIADQQTLAEQALAHRRAADFEARQVVERFNAFADAWNAFLAEYSAHGAFNVKKARTALQAWRKIEPSLPR
jgi:hypothetical protein